MKAHQPGCLFVRGLVTDPPLLESFFILACLESGSPDIAPHRGPTSQPAHHHHQVQQSGWSVGLCICMWEQVVVAGKRKISSNGWYWSHVALASWGCLLHAIRLIQLGTESNLANSKIIINFLFVSPYLAGRIEDPYSRNFTRELFGKPSRNRIISKYFSRDSNGSYRNFTRNLSGTTPCIPLKASPNILLGICLDILAAIPVGISAEIIWEFLQQFHQGFF